MNRLAVLTTLSARLDNTLNEFALTADANGQYPWQAAQQQKQKRRVIAGAVGAAAIGAGAYGAKKAHGAVMNRAADAAQGPVRARDAYGAMAQQGMDKVKTTLGGTRVAKYGKNLKAAYGQARKGSMVMGHTTGGKGMLGAAGAALRKVKFNRADQIIALEAKMDAALVEFGGNKESNLLTDLPEDWVLVKEKMRGGRIVSSQVGNKRVSGDVAQKHGGTIKMRGDEMDIEGYQSPARIRRAKAVAGMVATGVGGYALGKNSRRIVKGVKKMGSKMPNKNTKEHHPDIISIAY